MDFRKYEASTMLIIICLVNEPKPQNFSKVLQLCGSYSYKFCCCWYRNVCTSLGIGQQRLRCPAIIAIYILMQKKNQIGSETLHFEISFRKWIILEFFTKIYFATSLVCHFCVNWFYHMGHDFAIRLLFNNWIFSRLTKLTKKTYNIGLCLRYFFSLILMRTIILMKIKLLKFN